MSVSSQSTVNGPQDRLDGWKEIAVYLGRNERTLRRWEDREGLPVHRLAHDKRSSVFAYRSELDQWRSSRTDLEEENSSQLDLPASALGPLTEAPPCPAVPIEESAKRIPKETHLRARVAIASQRRCRCGNICRLHFWRDQRDGVPRARRQDDQLRRHGCLSDSFV